MMKKILYVFILVCPLLFISSCEDNRVFGCSDTSAFNYDSIVTVDDSSCLYIGAEITVVNAAGEIKPGFTVTTTINVDADYEPFREDVTNDMGKVSFYYEDIAILKVEVDSGETYYGEALLVLQDSTLTPITVVVYN